MVLWDGGNNDLPFYKPGWGLGFRVHGWGRKGLADMGFPGRLAWCCGILVAIMARSRWGGWGGGSGGRGRRVEV